MATEYSVIISGDCAAEHYALLKSAIAGLQSGSAVSAFEARFEAFDESITGTIDELLTTHVDFLCSGAVMAEEQGRFRWMWEGYGDGDAFMVKLLQLFDLLGLEGLGGESHGDEDVYCCQVTDESIDCEYVQG